MDKFKKILDQKMTRRQFLILVAVSIYALSGAKNILGNLSKESLTLPEEPGFGKGPYGGRSI